MRGRQLIRVVLLATALGACAAEKRPAPPPGQGAGGGNATGTSTQLPYPPAVTGTQTGTQVDVTPNCDPAQEFATLAFQGPNADRIRSCLQSGKLYDFENDTCTGMFRSHFACTYAGARAEITNIGLATTPLDEREGQKLKLVGCGASNNGYTIITQHWRGDPAKGCAYNPETIDTVCYRKLTGGESLPPSTDEKAWIASCMQP